MDENRVESIFVERCLKLSFQELSQYIEKCLDKMQSIEISGRMIPVNDETYDALIKLLDNKKEDLLSRNYNAAGRRLSEIAELQGRRYDLTTEQAETLTSFLEMLKVTNHKIISYEVCEGYVNQRWDDFAYEVEGITEYQPFIRIYHRFVNDLINECVLPAIKDIQAHPEFNSSHLRGEFGTKTSNHPRPNRKRLFNWLNKCIQHLLEATEVNIKIVENKISTYEQNRQLDIQDSKRKAELELQQKRQHKETVKKRDEYIAALKNKKEKLFSSCLNNLEVKRLSWRLLPKGQWTVEDIIRIFSTYTFKGWNDSHFDETRLRKITTFLHPNVCYVGENEFQGYVVFCFNWTDKVVLECPIFGNAIYIIKDNWQEITKLSKREARYKYPNQVTTIIHNDSWLERLRKELKS